MAWTVTDQGSNSNTTGATLARAVTATIVVGSLIVVGVTERSNASSGGSMTDDAGNTYTAVAATAMNNVSTNGFAQFFYSITTVQLNAAANVTYTKQTSGGRCCLAVGSATNTGTLSLDTSVTATAFGNSSTPSVTSGTPSVSGELFWGWAGGGNKNTLTADAVNGWTSPPLASVSSGTGTSDAQGVGGEQTNAGTGTKIHAPTIPGGTEVWADLIIGFKAAAIDT